MWLKIQFDFVETINSFSHHQARKKKYVEKKARKKKKKAGKCKEIRSQAMELASLVKGVSERERDRQVELRGGSETLAPQWWEFFNFKLVNELVHEDDESIVGAIFEYVLPSATNTGPGYVIAFRGAAIAMLAGKNRAKRSKFLESFLFNPPYASFPIETIFKDNKNVIRGLQLTITVIKGGVALALGYSGDEDSFAAISGVIMASGIEYFNRCGPKYLSNIDWNNAHHRRSVSASLVEGVYMLEEDRQARRGGFQCVAPPWWEFFNFKVVNALVDDNDKSIFGATFEYKPSAYSYHRSMDRSPRYLIAFEVWLTGHSLGAAMAMLAGKNMAKRGNFLEAFLFNPPYVSPPVERIKNKRVRHC
ncbi:hypothetical protein GOBAR_AA17669 [Gossypium barbadense]|uniref:Fungal lipase-type domain-containing protein n=1 Tax=Gossypium barbadense TaxID=3634 RepID=A0A2P5XHZ3_GOSBA|nr:hypothetical protein GOBAR_AA17669 [Gossypium barbadense]